MKNFTSLSGDSWLQGRRLLPILRQHGAKVRGSVLDLGCGTSPLRPLFASATRYIRVDRYPVDGEVIVIDDPQRLPLADGSIEVVLVSRMLGDLPDVVGVLRELARVLEDGGRILVYEAITYPQHDLPHDYWRVLPEGLRWAARKAGLTMTELEPLGGYFTQLAMHWNVFIVGDLGGRPLTRPVARFARAVGNLAFGALDTALPRPALASDYFAALVKPGSVPTATQSSGYA
jgi:SAM-dependent methyltransferase